MPQSIWCVHPMLVRLLCLRFRMVVASAQSWWRCVPLWATALIQHTRCFLWYRIKTFGTTEAHWSYMRFAMAWDQQLQRHSNSLIMKSVRCSGINTLEATTMYVCILCSLWILCMYVHSQVQQPYGLGTTWGVPTIWIEHIKGAQTIWMWHLTKTTFQYVIVVLNPYGWGTTQKHEKIFTH